MTTIAGIDIAQTISTAFDGELLPVKLTRITERYDPLTDETIEDEQVFTTEGIVQSYDNKLIADGLVQTNDRDIMLIGQKLDTVPIPTDKIEIENQTFTVVDIPKRDPAGATYNVQGRL